MTDTDHGPIVLITGATGNFGDSLVILIPGVALVALRFRRRPIRERYGSWQRARTMRSLCRGATRANTEVCSTAAAKAASSSLVEFDAGQHRRTNTTIPRSAAMRTAVRGWSPRDHDHADTGLAGLGNGHGRLFARRVDDAHGAEVLEILFERGCLSSIARHLRVGCQRAARHGQRA